MQTQGLLVYPDIEADFAVTSVPVFPMLLHHQQTRKPRCYGMTCSSWIPIPSEEIVVIIVIDGKYLNLYVSKQPPEAGINLHPGMLSFKLQESTQKESFKITFMHTTTITFQHALQKLW